MPGFSFVKMTSNPCIFAHDLIKTLYSSVFLQGRDMFNNLFDFSKPKTLKESIGFYVFYAGVFVCISGLLTLMGVR